MGRRRSCQGVGDRTLVRRRRRSTGSDVPDGRSNKLTACATVLGGRPFFGLPPTHATGRQLILDEKRAIASSSRWGTTSGYSWTAGSCVNFTLVGIYARNDVVGGWTDRQQTRADSPPPRHCGIIKLHQGQLGRRR